MKDCNTAPTKGSVSIELSDSFFSTKRWTCKWSQLFEIGNLKQRARVLCYRFNVVVEEFESGINGKEETGAFQ
jgi:hypothetical protein